VEPVVVDTRSEPPPSLRASVRGIRAWLASNRALLTWVVGLASAGGGATMLRGVVRGWLEVPSAAEVAELRGEVAALRASSESAARERSYESRETTRELDRLRTDGDRRDDSQDVQIERIRRRAHEPEPMRVTPRY
jgi:hypothetical protein